MDSYTDNAHAIFYIDNMPIYNFQRIAMLYINKCW